MKKFVKYIFSILLGTLTFCILYCCLVFFQLGAPTKPSLPFEMVYVTINEVADSFDENKLVIVSGSNSSFGIQCELIHQQEGIPCVNGGVHAALDINYIFYRARSWIQPGDIVLLPLEYHHYVSNGKPGKQMVDYIFSFDLDYLFSIDPISQFQFIFGVDFTRIIDGYIAKFKSPNEINRSELYKNRNKYGDITFNKKEDMTVEQREQLLKLDPISEVSGYVSSSHGMTAIKNFVDWCKSNNVTVIATYPNTIYFPAYEQKSQQEYFLSIKKFYEKLDVPIVGSPTGAMYDHSLFFNTIYHPHDQGAKYRTEQLVGLLKPIFDSHFTKDS